MTVELLSVADVARLVGLSEYTVRAAVRAGELHATKLRGRIRVHPDDLAGWVDAGRLSVAPVRGGGVAPRPRPSLPDGGVRKAIRDMNGRAA